MKKSILVPVIAFGLLVSAQAVTAQEATAEVTTTETTEVVAQDGMVAVSAEELPDAVKAAVAKDHEGMTIAEAHSTEDGSQFKLVLAKEGEENSTVLCDAEGNWLAAE